MEEEAAITIKLLESPDRSAGFAARLEILPELRRFVRSRIGEGSIKPDEVDRVVLAAHETAANVVRHALRDRPDEEFRVEVHVLADRVKLCFVHAGSAFDPADAPAPNFDGSREGGLGLFLIASCVDSATYDQDDAGRNRITLIRAFRTPTPVEP